MRKEMLFAYGSLRDGDIRKALFGGKPAGEPDVLKGYLKTTTLLEGVHYPNIVQAEGVDVHGELMEVDDETLIVVRGRDDVLRGFYNVCRHRGTAVVEEPCGKAVRFQCPYHAWIYDLEGRLVRAKHTDDLDDFTICRGDPVTTAAHVAFSADSRDAVDAFFAAAVANGATGRGEPGVWTQYSERYYGAFVNDLHQNNVEAVWHAPEPVTGAPRRSFVP